MVAQVTQGLPVLKQKKSLVRYEIGSKQKQEIKKLVLRQEIGGSSGVPQEYRERVKEVI